MMPETYLVTHGSPRPVSGTALLARGHPGNTLASTHLAFDRYKTTGL